MVTPRGYVFDEAILSRLEESCPAVKLLIQEISAAQDRREVAALLASFDLTQVPRRCLGAFQRHITDRLNELSD